MEINELLTELVLIANKLDDDGLDEISADLDAATYILSSEGARPINLSMASLVKAQYASLEGATQDSLEDECITAAESIERSFDKILQLEPKLATAIFKSIAQTASSFLDPEQTISDHCVQQCTELLSEAEQKLEQEELTSMGYRVGVIRSHLEKTNGQT